MPINNGVYRDHHRRKSSGQAPIGPVYSRLATITQLRKAREADWLIAHPRSIGNILLFVGVER
jgi:hypothetical protein